TGVHRKHREVPSAAESHARTRRVRYLLAVPHAADRSGPPESNRCTWRDRGEEPARRAGLDGVAARTLLRFLAARRGGRKWRAAGVQTSRHLSPGVSAARSATEERNVEGPADGDEVSGLATA